MSLINQEEIKLRTFAGLPTLLGGEANPVCLLQPLTVKEVIKLGDKYHFYLSLLTQSREEIEELAENIIDPREKNEVLNLTPFEFLMINAEYNDTFLMNLKLALTTFIKDTILIIPQAQEIVIGDISLGKKITKENFAEFQDIIRLQNRLEMPEIIPLNENFMQRKFRIRRRELKKAKAKQQARKGETLTLSDLIASICVLGIGITWENVLDLPISSLYELFSRYQKKEKYDLDVRSLLAGADSKKIKLKYWVRSSESDE